MKAIDLTQVYNKYKGLWVVLDKGYKTVVSANSNAKRAYEAAVKKGVRAPTLFKVPKQNIPFVGSPNLN